MSKRLRRIGIGLIALVLILAFGLCHLDRAYVAEPNPAWEASVDRPDIKRQQIYIDVEGATIEAEALTPSGGADRMAAVVFTTGSGSNIVQG